MDNNNNIGRILELTLTNSYYYKGKCIDENDFNIKIIDINGDTIEITKSSIMMKKVLS